MLQLRQASESFNLFQCVVGRLDILTNQRLALGLPRHGPMLPNHSALQANPGSGTARHGNTMVLHMALAVALPLDYISVHVDLSEEL